MSVDLFTPAPLFVTPNAVRKVQNLLREEGDPNLKLRVFITGGGCSGFQYGFSFDEEELAEDDTIIEQEGIKVVVDALSIQYLIVNNPNAVTTCGCGSSFTV